jgi:hypothetical protein
MQMTFRQFWRMLEAETTLEPKTLERLVASLVAMLFTVVV